MMILICPYFKFHFMYFQSITLSLSILLINLIFSLLKLIFIEIGRTIKSKRTIRSKKKIKTGELKEAPS